MALGKGGVALARVASAGGSVQVRRELGRVQPPLLGLEAGVLEAVVADEGGGRYCG